MKVKRFTCGVCKSFAKEHLIDECVITIIPKILGEINNFYVKIFKAQGEFVWHSHAHEDEFFLVIKGQLKIKLPEHEVTINEGEIFILPNKKYIFFFSNQKKWLIAATLPVRRQQKILNGYN